MFLFGKFPQLPIQNGHPLKKNMKKAHTSLARFRTLMLTSQCCSYRFSLAPLNTTDAQKEQQQQRDEHIRSIPIENAAPSETLPRMDQKPAPAEKQQMAPTEEAQKVENKQQMQRDENVEQPQQQEREEPIKHAQPILSEISGTAEQTRMEHEPEMVAFDFPKMGGSGLFGMTTRKQKEPRGPITDSIKKKYFEWMYMSSGEIPTEKTFDEKMREFSKADSTAFSTMNRKEQTEEPKPRVPTK